MFNRRKPSKQSRDRIEQKKLSELISESEEDESGLQSNKKVNLAECVIILGNQIFTFYLSSSIEG